MKNNDLKINNRRYIGSKTSLLDNIDSVIQKHFNNYDFVFADVFGGTGVVSNYYHEKGCKIIINDILYSNYVCYQTWLSNNEINLLKIEKIIKDFNKLDVHTIEENYFSDKFGGKYFHKNDAKKIGYIREEIETLRKNLTNREYFTLLTSLLYETDKIANTCGHFESFLNKKAIEKGINLRMPNINNKSNSNEIYCEDANKLVKKIKADVFYVDPPYNARQYINFYHVLENLVLWQKPEELEGNSMKFKRDHLKSDYSKAKAPDVFSDLIDNIDAKLIVVSYNNTYRARSVASNNKITEEQMLSILSKKGRVTKTQIDYKHFNAGKTDFVEHKEFLYVCEVD